MHHFILIFSAVLFSNGLFGQQLYIEAFTGRSTTNFNDTLYRSNSGFFPFGGKLAVGADHIQLGAEWSGNIRKPTFDLFDEVADTVIGNHKFKHYYYGLFLRGKLSRYPARRFGLNVIAGIGYLNLQKEVAALEEINQFTYDKALSYSAGVGISLPTQGMSMVEIGYDYRFVNLDEQPFLPAIRGSYHSFRLGFSLNFVFGKRAKDYDIILKK